ncbi:zinc finger protein 658-like isoform 2-T3 [Trichechus inunguis]
MCISVIQGRGCGADPGGVAAHGPCSEDPVQRRNVGELQPPRLSGFSPFAGYCITKPEVIFKLERGEEPLSLEEFPSHGYRENCKADVCFKGSKRNEEKHMWEVISINNKILTREGEKILEKPFKPGTASFSSRKIRCKCNSCRISFPIVSELIISDRYSSGEKADYINICEKLHIDINNEETHAGEESYEFNTNVKGLSYKEDLSENQKFRVLEEAFEYNESEKGSYDKVACITPESSHTEGKSSKDDKFSKT